MYSIIISTTILLKLMPQYKYLISEMLMNIISASILFQYLFEIPFVLCADDIPW